MLNIIVRNVANHYLPGTEIFLFSIITAFELIPVPLCGISEVIAFKHCI